MDNRDLGKCDRKILQISVSHATVGMIIAQDIVSSNNQLVLSKGTMLDSNMIAKIMYYSISKIYVYQEKAVTYDKRIQESKEFKQFMSVYNGVLHEIQTAVNAMLSGEKPIDQEELVSSVKKVLNLKQEKYHIVELIFCIKELDETTFAHSVNVALLCYIFGEWLRMSEEDKNILTIGGLMHDIGKVAIPKNILNKPGKLTNEEFNIVKMHPEKGYLLLLGQKVDQRIRLAALQHHERYDGTGYPLGKTGDQIHPFSMIVAIADVYDAMTSKRVYREEISPFNVLHMFEDDGKYLYNLKVLIPIIQRIAEIYINHTVLLSDNSVGEVIMINPQRLSQPVVRVDERFVDLSKDNSLSIKAVI